ncbi:hypothetical protein CNY89_28390, partial [Amaricoccus sp. HAR-UPW-R2A-40]
WNFVAVEERADWAEEGWSVPADPAHLRAALCGLGRARDPALAAVEETFLWGLFLWNFVAVEERADWAEEGWSVPADPAHLRAALCG